MSQFLSNKVIASIVALALLVGVGVLISSGDTSSTTRNAALVAGTPCTKVGQVTKVSKQAVVCAALSRKNIWYPIFQEKKWICAKLGITRKQNGIFSVCGKSKSSKKRWFLTKPLMANSNPGLPTTDQDAFIKLTTNPELIVETSPTTPLALAATTETTVPPATETPTTETPTTETPTSTPEISLTCATGGTCKVGDAGPGGGIVFYDAGAKQLRGRYLEAAPTDYQVNGLRASVVGGCDNFTNETATAIGAGKDNTTKILLKCPTAGIAARVAADYRGGGKLDWFLPSKDELNELCKIYSNGRTDTAEFKSDQNGCTGSTSPTGGFAPRAYWSSSEAPPNYFWHQSFGNGSQGYSLKTNDNYYVRPVRAFSTATPTTPTTTIARTYQVGDAGPGGGIVFYDAGTKQLWGRYLEAAPTDYQVSGVRKDVPWGCYGASIGPSARAIGTGKSNTDKILEICTDTGIAADVANKYSTSTAGAGQWFLPSRDELNELCKIYSNGRTDTAQYESNQNGCTGSTSPTGGFAAGIYWSSSEKNEYFALYQSFNYGFQEYNYNPKGFGFYVRPVRAF